MKKSILRVLVLVLTMVFVFVGCSKESKPDEKKQESQKPTVSFTTKEEINGNVKIKYPQIENQKAENISDINTSIKFFIKDRLNEFCNENKDVSADIDFKVTVINDKRMSILFTGVVTLPDKDPQNFIHGITVGFDKGRLLTIADVTLFDDEFPKTVKAGKVTTISGEGVEEAQAALKALDDMSIIDGIRMNRGTYSFHLTENSILVSFPVSEELGGYAFSEIELQKDFELVPS